MFMPQTWTFHSAGQIVFGPGAAASLGKIAARLRLKRVLIVTDQVLVKAGVVDQVRSPLAESGIAVEVFDGGEPEPSIRVAGVSAAAARAFAPDGLVGLGGGS